MADLAGVIFDLDGTLIDSAPDIHATAQKVLAAEGMAAMDFATIKGFIGAGVGTLIARMLTQLGRESDVALADRMFNHFISLYEEAFDMTTVYPDVGDMLEMLASRGHPLAICTNKPEAPTRAALGHFGLLHHFAVIIGGDTLPQRKPDPAPLRLALDQLGTRRTLFVGDSEVDAQTAAATPLPFALFTGGYRKTAPELLGATVIFDHHAELPGRIATLFA